MKDFNKKILIQETTEKAVKMFKKHPDKQIENIVKKISESYCLTENEEEILLKNTKDILEKGEIEKVKVKFEQNMKIQNSIEFPSLEELNKACELLMKRNLGWKVKGDDNNPFLQFDNSLDIKKAIMLLRAEWNFIEKYKKTVGVISFDNYEDLEKVYEFMRRSGMFLESKENSKLVSLESSEIVIDEAYLAKPTTIQTIDQNRRYINVFKKR